MEIKPIGIVTALGDGNALLEIEPSLEPAFLGVEPGTRLDVLYWMHELDAARRAVLQTHPRGDRSRPVRGVFALRSPMRPNPIGVTTVTVLDIDGASLTVEGLDAHDGSPIIDIKMARG